MHLAADLVAIGGALVAAAVVQRLVAGLQVGRHTVEGHARTKLDVVGFVAVVAIAARAAARQVLFFGVGQARNAHGQIQHRRQHKGAALARLQIFGDLEGDRKAVAVRQLLGSGQIAPVQHALALETAARQHVAHKVALAVALQIGHVAAHLGRSQAFEGGLQTALGAAICGDLDGGVHALLGQIGTAGRDAAQRLVRAHVDHRLGISATGQVAKRHLLGRGIQVHLEVGQVVDDVVDGGHHGRGGQVVQLTRIDQHLLAAHTCGRQQRLQQRGVVFAVAHFVVEHDIHIARHHRPYANAIAAVGDLRGHPFVQQPRAFARVGLRAHDGLGQCLDARRRPGLGQGALAIGAGNAVVVGKRAHQQHGRFVQPPDTRIGLVPGLGRGVLVAPLAHGGVALLHRGLLLQAVGFKAQVQALGGADGDAAVFVHTIGREALHHRESAGKDGLFVIDAVAHAHRIAHGQVRKHHGDAGAVREQRLGAITAIAHHGLVIGGGHRYAAAVGLEGVGLQDLRCLNARAVGERKRLHALQRTGVDHLVLRGIRHRRLAVSSHVIVHMPQL